MTKFLISFPSSAMQVAEEDFPTVVEESHAVIQAAQDAGVYVFGGGIDDSVPPVRVAADGTVTDGTYPQTRQIEGGYTVLELPSRDDAVQWAARIAAACRCEQELRQFGFDELS